MSASDWLQICIGIYFFLRRGVVFMISKLPRCTGAPALAELTTEIAEGAD